MMESPPVTHIVCPQCHQPTDSIKRFTLISMLFLFVGARWQTTTWTICPECMRGKILRNTAINIVTANLLFPILILPLSLYQFAMTYRAGHDQNLMGKIRTSQFNRQLSRDSGFQPDIPAKPKR